MIIGKVRLSLRLCGVTMIWPRDSTATCGVGSPEGLIVVRFFLGDVEAPLFQVLSISCPSSKTKRIGSTLCHSVHWPNACVLHCRSHCCGCLLHAHTQGYIRSCWLAVAAHHTGFRRRLSRACSLLYTPGLPDSTTGSARWSMTEDMRKVVVARIIADRVSSESKAGVG